MSATAVPTKSKVTREFTLALSDGEFEARANEAGALLSEVEQIREEAKADAARHKAKIDERMDRLGILAPILDKKSSSYRKETREVEAEMIKDFASASKRFFLAGKLIHEEAMTAQELQMEIGDVVSPKKKAKTAADGRREDALKAEASKKKGKAKTADIVKLETNRKTKRSTVDGVYDQ